MKKPQYTYTDVDGDKLTITPSAMRTDSALVDTRGVVYFSQDEAPRAALALLEAVGLTATINYSPAPNGRISKLIEAPAEEKEEGPRQDAEPTLGAKPNPGFDRAYYLDLALRVSEPGEFSDTTIARAQSFGAYLEG